MKKIRKIKLIKNKLSISNILIKKEWNNAQKKDIIKLPASY